MSPIIPANAAAIILDAALQSFVVLAAAGAVCLGLRRASAATRHFVWFLSAASLLLLPFSSALLPAWPKPVWSISAGPSEGNQYAVALEFAPSAVSTIPNKPLASSQHSAGTLPSRQSQLNAQINVSWVLFAVLVWVAGALLALGSLLASRWRVWRLERRSPVMLDGEWSELLLKLRGQLRVRRVVTLRQSGESVMPATWGTRRPVVMLPAQAKAWPPERRRIVLQHELAHARRLDCLTQTITSVVCALYWFNPLAWLAARRMCVERERACDDVVLGVGCKPSDYASHLVEIARSFRRLPPRAAIAMARSCQLEDRVAAIVDASRLRGMSRMAMATAAFLAGGMLLAAGGFSALAKPDQEPRGRQIAHLEVFAKAKEAQAKQLAAKAGESTLPEFQTFFDAATKGDTATVLKMFDSFKKRHPQYENSNHEINLRTSYWQTVLEISLAYDYVAKCEPAYTQMAIEDLLRSIPAGSVYFGGTDPGRGVPTAFCKSHMEGDPFFTLTQNALADDTYLAYLRAMYGGKIHLPSTQDAENCFSDYLTGARARLAENKLRPGESVVMDGQRVQVSGAGAVMAINASLVKIIFDKNPDREFYIEESYPLDWMYPYLEPHGLILKIDRKPLDQMPEETVQKDRAYWNPRVAGMIGDWLTLDTPPQTVAEFVERVYERGDLSGFTGDRKFMENDYAKRSFSKWRSATAGLYAWRAANSKSADEQKRMLREAQFAYAQAWALCPYSPEIVVGYAKILPKVDALLFAETASHVMPRGSKASEMAKLTDLIKDLQNR